MSDLKKQRAAAALLAAPTFADAAREAGCTVRTLKRWREDADFRALLRDLSRDEFDEARARLRAAAGEAVSTLIAGMRGRIQYAIPVRCACAILERCAALESDDVIERLEALERAAADRRQHAA